MLGFRSELLNSRALDKSHVVLVCGSDPVGMTFGSFFDELKKRHWLFLAVDDKGAIEDFMSAMLRVDLGEAEYFRIGEWTAELLRDIFQVIHFFLT